MSKMLSLLFKLQIVLCLALIFSLNIFGQSVNLKNDLSKSFKKFDLIRLNDGEALQKAEGRQSLTIQTSEKTFSLSVVPHDMRSSSYRAAETTSDGIRSLKKGEVNTFKGMIDGEPNSQVRLTVDSSNVAGFFVSNATKYFIEPANHHSEFAEKGDFVIYKDGDFLNDEGFACDSEIQESIEFGKNYVFPNGSADLTGLRVLKLATDADFEYVTQSGGAAAANQQILGILNMVEGAYQNELGLTIRVVFQHAWTTGDPFATNNPGTDPNCQTTIGKVLCNFKNYWNMTFPNSQTPRDTAHLWSGKDTIANRGLAYVRVVCNPTSAYGVSGPSPWQEARLLISAHEIGHNLGANHAEETQSCANTLMNAALSTVTPLSFCTYSRTEVSNYITPNGGCLTPQNTASTRFDFDGDNKADVTVFRPANGVWYINKSTGGFNAFQFGLTGDKPVSADYDGDGKTDAAVYRGGVWYILRSSNGSFQAVGFGLADDIPTPADFDGDGKADIAVFRPSNGVWHFLNSSNGAYSSVQFGLNGDVPVTGDYDGDGKADINLYRPSSGVWYRLNSSNGAFFAAQFGLSEDKALSGDFDGDGKYDLAVWRPSNGAWYVLKSSNGGFQAVGFGLTGDIPTAADFDGDGKADFAVFRPSSGVWYFLNSSNNAFAALQFGLGTDLPAQSYYVR
ncbi:MAG: FG-GAP-like repeat-containing protein [Pyrinomonadaceae bacterium]